MRCSVDARSGRQCCGGRAVCDVGTSRGDNVAELRVRVGIHTGAAEQRDGDYFGTAVNRAARLMSVAHGGQIVVSLATEELVRDVLGTVSSWSISVSSGYVIWRAASGSFS